MARLCSALPLRNNIKKIAFLNIIFTVFLSNSARADTPLEAAAANANGTVFRIICHETESQGTGFLHKSGYIITAAHVVKNCRTPTIAVPGLHEVATDVVADDNGYDLALLKPKESIKKQGLQLGVDNKFRVGEQVATFGFPGGYDGGSPLLSVGYFGGIDQVKDAEGRPVWRFIVNAAFNHGNSGGPLVSVETGKVIGVVSDKLMPFRTSTENAINQLLHNRNGLQVDYTDDHGNHSVISEGQLIALSLVDLINNAQLVVGHTTDMSDIVDFLRKNKIEP